MANEITKCPMCGTKLKMIGGRMTCKECGYYVRSTEEQSASEGASFPQHDSNTAGSRSSRYVSSGQSGYSGRPTVYVPSSPGRPAEHNPTVAIVIGVLVGVVCVALFALIVMLKSGFFQDMFPHPDSRADSYASSNARASSSQASKETDAPTRETVGSGPITPQSSFFRSVAEYIWDKPCDTITTEELASLTALQIDRDERSITFQLNGGETDTAT